MIEYVSKRNGGRVLFDESKIYTAITCAYVEVYGDINDKEDEIAEITDNVIDTISQFSEIIHVETIQDIIEKEIAQHDFAVARAYITYRYKRKVARDDYTVLMDVVSEKLGAKNVENQNANVDERSFGGRLGAMTDEVSKHYALNYLMSPMAKKNHEGNMIYVHDLNHYAVGDHNCLSCPIDKLLKEGFNTRQCDVRPAKSISTALQLVAVIFQIQSLQQFGGVSATHLDHSMMPYVRISFNKHYADGLLYIKHISENVINKSDAEEHSIEDDLYKKYPDVYKYALDMTKRETYQAVEGLFHNLNTLQSRSGNQLPFSSINYGTCTDPEGRMVTKAILDVSISGIGKLHRTSIFPCGIFQYMKGINDSEGTPNYDLFQLAIKSTAKRLYPNYANCDWSGNAGYDKSDPKTYFSTMGKRKLQLI